MKRSTITSKSERYLLELRAEPGRWQAPPISRLKRLLKAALRGYGFRATEISTDPIKPSPGKELNS